MVLSPLGVGGKSHSEPSVVCEVFSKSEVAIHYRVSDGIIGILVGKARSLTVERLDCFFVVQLCRHPLAGKYFANKISP